jgi:hypothetical protein
MEFEREHCDLKEHFTGGRLFGALGFEQYPDHLTEQARAGFEEKEKPTKASSHF